MSRFVIKARERGLFREASQPHEDAEARGNASWCANYSSRELIYWMLESLRTARNSPTRVKQKSERRLQTPGLDALLRKYTGPFEVGQKTLPAAGSSWMTLRMREGSPVVAIGGCLFRLPVYSQGLPCTYPMADYFIAGAWCVEHWRINARRRSGLPIYNRRTPHPKNSGIPERVMERG